MRHTRQESTPRISTHTSRVGCDKLTLICSQIRLISTHTSRVGCDTPSVAPVGTEKKFLLTHPVWDVTYYFWFSREVIEISTHTSRVGCDEKQGIDYIPTIHISTHTSRVGCDADDSEKIGERNFYSHIPCGM